MLLRYAGAVEILAFIAVVMPWSWMEVTHAALGLGEMSHGPLLIFMIRQASYTYGVHGLSLWLIATDVERFRPFIERRLESIDELGPGGGSAA